MTLFTFPHLFRTEAGNESEPDLLKHVIFGRFLSAQSEHDSAGLAVYTSNSLRLAIVRPFSSIKPWPGSSP